MIKYYFLFALFHYCLNTLTNNSDLLPSFEEFEWNTLWEKILRKFLRTTNYMSQNSTL